MFAKKLAPQQLTAALSNQLTDLRIFAFGDQARLWHWILAISVGFHWCIAVKVQALEAWGELVSLKRQLDPQGIFSNAFSRRFGL